MAANPITRLRERLRMSRVELARASGTNYQQLARAELGYEVRLPRAAREALAAFGEDPDSAALEYRAWRESLRFSEEGQHERREA